MSTTTTAATDTAKTTVNENDTLATPGRDELLKAIAREAMGEPEAAAPPANADTENADEDALSQTQNQEATETPEEQAAREQGEADDQENHLEDDLRDSLPEEVQQAVNRRIGKEVAKTKSEREKREALESENNDLKAKLADKPSVAPAKTALSEIHDPQALTEKSAEAREALRGARRLMRQVKTDPYAVEEALRGMKVKLVDSEGNEDFSQSRMEAWLGDFTDNIDEMLSEQIPARETFLKSAENFAAQAVELMPELKDPKSARVKKFQQIIRETPGLQTKPEWPLMAMAGVKALEWLEETLAAKAKSKTTLNPKPKRDVPVTIPAPRAQAMATRRNAPHSEDANTTADRVLGGDKNARLKILQQFVPKQ